MARGEDVHHAAREDGVGEQVGRTAHDVELPGSAGPKVGFLMYPQAEVDGERLDSLDPDSFKYVIKAKEISA